MTSLNPYYTGIHLHCLCSIREEGYRRLNPYYTGIHLHYVFRYFRKHAVAVLILIILEYIYIFEYGDLTVLAGVLILIILEYIYICENPDKDSQILRLNPYYTGIHLHNI